MPLGPLTQDVDHPSRKGVKTHVRDTIQHETKGFQLKLDSTMVWVLLQIFLLLTEYFSSYQIPGIT